MRQTLFVLFILLMSSCVNKREKMVQGKDSLSLTEENPTKCENGKAVCVSDTKRCCNISEKPSRLDSIRDNILKTNNGIKDSISYKFSLDNEMGTEGNDGIAFYKKGRLNMITMQIYTDRGLCDVSYAFYSKKKIKVCEKNYSYVNDVEEIKYKRGVPSVEEYCSYINENGKSIDGKNSVKNDDARKVYSIIKRNIPYELRKDIALKP